MDYPRLKEPSKNGEASSARFMVARPFSKQRTPTGVTQGSFVSHGKHCSQTRESGLPSTCSTSLTLPSRRPVAPLRSSMVMLVSTRGANSSMRR